MDIKLGKRIGTGSTADVYEYGNDTVMKLYSEGFSVEAVKFEYDKTIKAYENNLPAPKVFEMVEYNNRFGFTMEYIHGETIMNEIARCLTKYINGDMTQTTFAEQTLGYIKQTARFLYMIHKSEENHTETMNNDPRLVAKLNSNRILEEKHMILDDVRNSLR